MNKKSMAAAIALACLTTTVCAASNDDTRMGAADGLSHYGKINCTGTPSCDDTP